MPCLSLYSCLNSISTLLIFISVFYSIGAELSDSYDADDLSQYDYPVVYQFLLPDKDNLPDLYEMYGLSENDYPVLHFNVPAENVLPREIPCECDEDESQDRNKYRYNLLGLTSNDYPSLDFDFKAYNDYSGVDFLVDLYNDYVEDGKLNGEIIPKKSSKEMMQLLFDRPVEIENTTSSEMLIRPLVIHESQFTFDILQMLLNGTFGNISSRNITKMFMNNSNEADSLTSSEMSQFLMNRRVEIENMTSSEILRRPLVIHKSKFTFDVLKNLLNDNSRNRSTNDMIELLMNSSEETGSSPSSEILQRLLDRRVKIQNMTSSEMQQRPFFIHRSNFTVDILKKLLNGSIGNKPSDIIKIIMNSSNGTNSPTTTAIPTIKDETLNKTTQILTGKTLNKTEIEMERSQLLAIVDQAIQIQNEAKKNETLQMKLKKMKKMSEADLKRKALLKIIDNAITLQKEEKNKKNPLNFTTTPAPMKTKNPLYFTTTPVPMKMKNKDEEEKRLQLLKQISDAINLQKEEKKNKNPLFSTTTTTPMKTKQKDEEEKRLQLLKQISDAINLQKEEKENKNPMNFITTPAPMKTKNPLNLTATPAPTKTKNPLSFTTTPAPMKTKKDDEEEKRQQLLKLISNAMQLQLSEDMKKNPLNLTTTPAPMKPKKN